MTAMSKSKTNPKETSPTQPERGAIEDSIRGIPLAELLAMARRHLVDRESAEEVCGDRFKPQQFRQAMFEARRRNLLRQFVILTPELQSVPSLDALARDVEEAARRFRTAPPLRVHLVVGDREVFDRTRTAEPRDFLATEEDRDLYLRNEAVLERIIDEAVEWVSRELSPNEVFIPAWGTVVRKLVGGLRPWSVRRKPIDLTVVAGSGLLGVTAFADYEASNNARLAGEILGTSRVHLLPLPFCVPGDRTQYAALHQLAPVQRTEAMLASPTLVVTSLQDFNPARYSVVRHGLMPEAHAQKYAQLGACGEIAGVPFNDHGDEVTTPDYYFAGIHPADLKRTVGKSDPENPKVDKHDRRKREVLVLAGATSSRLHPLSVAIRSGLVTRVFTDHITAQALLREFEEN